MLVIYATEAQALLTRMITSLEWLVLLGVTAPKVRLLVAFQDKSLQWLKKTEIYYKITEQ